MTDTPAPAPIRVLIADDQRVVREGLSMLVALIDDVEVVGAACDGAGAWRLAETYRPDVILMDLRMPDLDGIAATGLLRERLPAARVLVLATYADEDAIVPALAWGLSCRGPGDLLHDGTGGRRGDSQAYLGP